MFKFISVLMRGAAAASEEAFADRHALLILDQQMRDAAAALEAAKRARRIARSTEAVRRLRATVAWSGSDRGALRDAEQTLKRLREKQAEAEAEDAALAGLDAETSADHVAQRLEDSGFGPRTRPTGADVLERLKRKVAGDAPPSA